MTERRWVRAVAYAALLVIGWSVPVVIGVSGHFVGLSMAAGSMPMSHLIGHSIATWWPWIPVTPLAVLAWRRLPRRGLGVIAVPLVHLSFAALAFVLQAWMAVVIGHRTGHVMPHTGFVAMALMSVSELVLYDLIVYGGILAMLFGLDYAKRYRDRDLIASQLEAQLAQARLTAMQMQLQPHFLFNALNSVAMLVRTGRSRDALDVIIGFSELLRYVLDEAGTVDVALGTELRFARQYLDIERVRYGDRLAVEMDVPAALEDALVPNLLLQPLVENAIKHGIATRASGGAIAVHVTQERGQLIVRVRNDGPLLPTGWSLDDADGVGLRNVRDRLQAFAGAEATLVLTNVPDGSGVEVRIALPLRRTVSRRAPVAAGIAARAG
jgi:hypothetical protein